ncbi:MAG TPA: hypothetical protein VFI65_32210 [Streptosporangiaceae bacterium]|nr:hypothetical protein [Streptosporangiaceae bacterium]
MRTENDLRAVLRALEPADPDQGAVLSGVRRRIARRRVLQAGSGLSAVAAAVTVIAMVTGGPVGQPAPSPTADQQVQTAAYIVRHAANAEQNAARMIQVSNNGAGVSYTSVATQQTVFISNLRIHGRPLLASAEGITGTTYTSTLVDYKDRAYNIVKASTRDGGPWGAKGLVIASWLPGVTASDPAAAYTAALRKGTIKVIGYRNLHGKKTILIQINGAKDKADNGAYGKPQAGRAQSCKALPRGKFEVWLDASTYLEIQEAQVGPKFVKSKSGCFKFSGWSTTTTKLQWLRPTKHNLALLNLTPPAGFAQVSGHQMDLYLSPYS